MTDVYEWIQAEPRALARHVRPQDVRSEFTLPSYINRLDLLQAEGPLGLAAALYQRIARLGLNYDLAPFNPRSGVVQQIRTPARILVERRATCLDLAVLFAATCLANDLLSLIVALEGHAFVGVALNRTRRQSGRTPKALAWDRGLLADLAVLREQAGSAYLLVECTGLVRSQALSAGWPEGQGREASGAMSFERACAAGAEQVACAVAPGEVPAPGQRRLLFALDIHDLQVNHGFAPLASAGGDNGGDTGGVSIRAGGNVSIGGDVVGRDKITTTTTTHTGDTFTVGDVSGSRGLAIGRGARATVTQGGGDLAAAFAAIYRAIETRPLDPGIDKDAIIQTVQRIETETGRGALAEAGELEHWVTVAAGKAPDILEVMAAAFTDPATAAGVILKQVIHRVRSGRRL